jgi:hypothetical protein
MGPTTADMSTIVQEEPRHQSTAALAVNESSIPLLYCHEAMNVASLTNHVETDKNAITTNSQLAIMNRQASRQELFSIETSRHQQSLGNPFPLKSVTELPSPYLQSIPNNSLSYQLPIPSDLINKSLLPNNSSPIFSAQTKITAPLKQKTRKELNLVKTQPTKKPTRPDLKLTQIYPNPNPITTSPSLNPTGPEPAIPNPIRDSAVDMDSHTEKKRRREENRQIDSNDEDSNQHFLSAGPGSQDCREQ